jgi:hypothetical protein
MKISTKKSFNNWIKVGEDGEQFLIDYPSVEQQQELQSIQFGSGYTGDDKALKYFQYYLKYVIKDWKGIFDENGREIKCVVKNNELDNDLWWSLVSDQMEAIKLYKICFEELNFTDADKKKFSTQESSSEKVSSQGEEKTIP